MKSVLGMALLEKSIMKSVLGMALLEILKAVYHGLSKQSLTWFWSRANMGNTLLHFGHENVLSRSRLVVPRNSSASSLCLSCSAAKLLTASLTARVVGAAVAAVTTGFL